MSEPNVVDVIAQAIRVTDGSHELGASTLAESLLPTVRALMAQAYAEGYEGAIDDYGTDIPWTGLLPPSNPYGSALSSERS